MADALGDFSGGVLSKGAVINNLRFADDIGLLTESGEDLKDITQRLNDTCLK